MMSLEEAIKHCDEVAEKYCDAVEEGLKPDDFCDSCASEHRQLAEWLRELKAYRISVALRATGSANTGYIMAIVRIPNISGTVAGARRLNCFMKRLKNTGTAANRGMYPLRWRVNTSKSRQCPNILSRRIKRG